MENTFVSYDIALKLKEKRFSEPCFAYYQKDGNISYSYIYDVSKLPEKFTIAPSKKQLTDWLEKKYGFFFERLYNELEKEGFIVWKDKKPINMEQYNDINQSINEALKLI